MDNKQPELTPEQQRALLEIEEVIDTMKQEITEKFPGAQPISEEDGVHKEWYKEARNMTMDNLPAFLKKLSEGYIHDYGTICHAIAASAIAAAWSVERTPQGGITGFQAGAVMWEFIRHWQYSGKETLAASLQDYEHLLFPQYEYRFTTVSKETWDYIQKLAQKNIDEHPNGENMSLDVYKHWKSIVAGKVPFGLKIREDD